MVLIAEDSEAQTNPPGGDRDWNIYDTTVISNQRVTLGGNLNVYTGGKLTLNNVDLVFTRPGLGTVALRVRNNGELVWNVGSAVHSSSSGTYKFIIDRGAKVEMGNVTVSHTWHNPSNYVSSMQGGVIVGSNDVTMRFCTFTKMDRVAMTIEGTNPKLYNCTFKDVSYYTWYKDYNSVDREAFGVVVLGGAPEFTGCGFYNLGAYETAYNDYPTGYYYYTYLRLDGHGVYSFGGYVKIKECHFEEIGRIHDSWSKSVYFPELGRTIRFYFWNQDDHACVRANNPLMLEVWDSTFEGNFPGYPDYTDEGYGILQEGGKSSLKRNTFQANGGTCIYVNDGEAVVKDTLMADFIYYGLYVRGGSKIDSSNLTINGTAEARPAPRREQGLRLYYVGGSIDLRELNITFCYYGVYVYDATLAKVYDTYINNCSKKVYANRARVDMYNSTVSRTDIELGWNLAEVNIYWNLDVQVTWQNGVPIPGAVVQIFNESKGLLKANKAGDDGRMPTLTLLQTTVKGTSNSQSSLVNSPLLISAYANATESELYTVTFESYTLFQCILEDALPPNVEVYYPLQDHAQNYTTMALYGIAVDVGSGLRQVDVSFDGETWYRANGSLTWNLTIDLPEGVYDIRVRGTDVAGASGVNLIKNVTVDLTEPWLVITSPDKSFIYTNQTTLTIIGQAEIGADVYLNGEWLETLGGQFFTQISGQQEGLNTYEIMALDHVGNQNITLLQVYQDITAPILLVEHPPEEYVTNERVLEISGLTELDVRVTINDMEVAVENGLFTMSMTLQEGLNLIEIEAVDLARNHRHASLRVTYDITPPRVVMEYPVRDEAVNRSIVVVSGSVDPDVSSVRVNQVPVNIRDGTFKKNFKLSEGNNLVVIEVTDLAGNHVTRSYWLYLDTEAPMLVLDSPEDGSWSTEETVRVSGRVEVGAIVTVNGAEVMASGGYFVFDAPLEETEPGKPPNVLLVRATDPVGNEVSYELRVYRDTSPPVLSVYPLSDSTSADFINVTGNVRDPKDLVSLRVNDLPVQPTRDGFFEAYMPLDLGENTFVVTAVDAAGNTASGEVSIFREALKVKDEGIMGLGDSSWLVLVLFLMIGVSAGMVGLYVIDRRREGEEVAS